MKVVVEISDKILNLASGTAMMMADSEQVEKNLSEVIERMKSSEEPTFIDFDKIDDERVKIQMPLSLALFAIGQEMEKMK